MILDRFRLDGRVAVVTGGTKGIGRAVALALAQAGADLAVVSRNPDQNLEQQIKTLGRKYYHCVADLACRDQTRRVVPEVAEALGGLDILVNNAGLIRRAPAVEYPEADWDATLEIDLSAAFLLSQSAGRLMLAARRGKIVNIASVLAYQGGINVAAYVAAKHGLAGLTRAMSNEWAGRGVNVNALAPGYVATELTEALMNNPDRSQGIINRTPVGRWGRPEDIAGAAVFLASPAADYITGVVLPIDGGWLAW